MLRRPRFRILRALAYIGCFVVLALVIVLAFHANDARLPTSFAGDGNSARSARGRLLQSVLRGSLAAVFPAGQLPTHNQIGEHARRNQLTDVRLTAASTRFSRPWQVSVSIGTYPGMVEARDGIFVPAGGSFNVPLPSQAGQVRFGLALIDGSEAWEATGQPVRWDGAKENTPGTGQRILRWIERVTPGLFVRVSRWIFQFIRPEAALSSLTGRRWLDFSVPWPGGGDDPSGHGGWTLHCKSSVPCIFSDVEFLSTGDQPVEAPAVSSTPPNFVVVVVDTLRGDAVFKGDAPAPFPAFASRSASFVRALSPGNMTSPSTNAFLGCRTPTELKSIAFAYAVNEESRQNYYRGRSDSFPARFAAAGYKTGMVGNISVVSEVIGVGVDHGFQENISVEVEGYETAVAGLVARKWIQENKGAPFLLYVHLNAPHAPYKAPLKDIFDAWTGMQALQSLGDALRWLYAGEVRYAARTFDGILQELDAAGLSNNTHVILTGDHGDQHSNHRFSGNEAGPVAMGAYFDHGATLFDDEVNVPLIWRGPGVMPSRHETHVSTLGVGSAMIQMAADAGVGVDFGAACSAAARAAGSAIVARVASSLPGDDPAAAPTFGIEGYQYRAVVFDGRYKYIRAHEPVGKKLVPPSGWFIRRHEFFSREQLYDLHADWREEVNLAMVGRDGTLMARARREYDRFYQVSSGFELVVESPAGQAIEVTKLGFYSAGSKRVVISVPAGVRAADLVVKVGGEEVKISAASLRLPLPPSTWPGLPREPGGEDSLLAARNVPNAYLRRVLVNDGEVRRIVSGNPMFDQVLRDWGYLHDD